MAVLEAMKMEVVIGAPFGGRVSEVLVAPNVQVEAGAPLLRLEPAADDPGEPGEGGGQAASAGAVGLDLDTLETVEGLHPAPRATTPAARPRWSWRTARTPSCRRGRSASRPAGGLRGRL